MESVRKAILTKSDADVEAGDYVAVTLDDESSLWFTQTHFAEIRELMQLSEEVKTNKQKEPVRTSEDDESEESAMSVYAGYKGKVVRRKDGFAGKVTEVATEGEETYLYVHVIGGKNAGKDTKIQLAFILKNRNVYTVSDE